jgi:alanyl-tRNA synthetase
VNRHIRDNQPVGTRLMTPEDAVAAGALALFGEKYGDEVRVLSMGTGDGASYSVELCGGTHVSALGDIQLFKIVSESAVAAGVRRIEALTGEAARRWLTDREEKLRAAAATLKAAPDDVPARVTGLIEEKRRLERELAEAKKALALGGGSRAEAAGPETVGGHGFIGQVLEDVDPKGLRGLVDEAKKRVGSGIVTMIAVNEGRASIAVGVTEDLTGTRNAVELVRKAVEAVGGQGGGGRPDMAQGGGPDGSRAAEALAAVKEALEKVAA